MKPRSSVERVKTFPVRGCVSVALLALAACPGALHAQTGAADSITPGLPRDRQSYEARRSRLRAAAAARRFDAGLRLSPEERRVDERLAALRAKLVAGYRDRKRFPPAEPFHSVKQEIHRTQLYRMLRDMPKGGVLHLHTSSTAPADWIVEEGIRAPHCCVCWPKDHGDAIRGQLGFFRPDDMPDGYQSVKSVLERDPEFPAKLRRLITINADDDALNGMEIWGKFDAVFQRIGGLVSYEPLFEQYYTAAFESLLADNVSYVELRAGFGGLYDLDGRTFDVRHRTRSTWKVRNRIREDHPEFDLKLICSGHRHAQDREVWSQLETAVALRKQWRKENFVVGFDLVGEEDAGRRTEDFLADWIRLRTYLQEHDTPLPLYFHDGESDWPRDDNLDDAYLLGSRRIGHGFNLFRFPDLEKRLIADGVAVEVCPISNQMLRYVHDLRVHPAAGYLARGVPCVLGNDDPGILGNDGLTYDFWEAVVAWNLDLRSVKQLARNSLEYSAMTESEKSRALRHWQKAWDRWIARYAREGG